MWNCVVDGDVGVSRELSVSVGPRQQAFLIALLHSSICAGRP